MKPDLMRVTMFAGGGLAHTSGGVGTFIRYLEDEWATLPRGPKVRVIDSYGTGSKVGMACHFSWAVVCLLVMGATGRIDILHVHMTFGGRALRKGILTILGNVLRIPVIVHMHGSNFQESFAGLPGFAQRALRFALSKARHIIVLGNSSRDFLVAEAGVSPEKIAIIFNGVPGPEEVVRPSSPPGGRVQIVFLGRLGERKGVPDLLAAFRSPQLLSRAWKATIAGDGPVAEWRAAVVQAGLQDRVVVPGWLNRDATSDLLRTADIFVLPSHFEAMPVAILEALAHRVAVVTTPVGAIPEFLSDGQNAVLVPPGAPDQLASALARLIDDPGERSRLGAAGHQVFRDRFDISVAANQILALYQDAAHVDSTRNGVGRGVGRGSPVASAGGASASGKTANAPRATHTPGVPNAAMNG